MLLYTQKSTKRGKFYDNGWFDAALELAVPGNCLLYFAQIKRRRLDMTGYIIALLLAYFLNQYSLTTIIIVMWPTILVGLILLGGVFYVIFKKP